MKLTHIFQSKTQMNVFFIKDSSSRYTNDALTIVKTF